MAAPLLNSLAESLGSPEPAVRLICSIAIGKIRFVNQPVSHPGCCCCYFCVDMGIFSPYNFNSAERLGQPGWKVTETENIWMNQTVVP